MAKNDEGKAWAFLAMFLSILGFLIVLLAKKDNKYAMYYAQQSLVLFIVSLIVSIVGTVVPFIGWLIILPIGSLIVLILWVIGLIYSVSGEMKPLPLIGKYGENFKI